MWLRIKNMKFHTSYKKLIIVLAMSNLVFAALYFTKRVDASNRVSVCGAIEVYDSDGVSPLTSHDFPLFTGGFAETSLKCLFVNSTGNQPVYVYWNISTSSISWEMSAPHLDSYDHYEDGVRKYGFAIRQDFTEPVDYWHPDVESVVLGVGEGVELWFELNYTGEPDTAEKFTMTISFYATGEHPQDPVAMLEDLKAEIDALPSEAFRVPWLVEWQKKGLCRRIDRVIKSIEKSRYEWAIWQLEWLKWRIGRQILDPYRVMLIGEVEDIINTLTSVI